MDESRKQALEPSAADRGYEHSDVAIRPLAIFLAGLAGTLIVVAAICVWVFDLYLSESERADPAPAPLAEEDSRPSGPLLQVSSRDDLAALRQREAQVLDTPAWIDRDAGVARIPIEQAIEIVAKRGLPNWPPVAAPPTPENTPPPNETSSDQEAQP